MRLSPMCAQYASAFLDEANRAGGSRPEVDGDVGTQADYFIVSVRQRRVEETLRIENWQLRGHEHVLHDL